MTPKEKAKELCVKFFEPSVFEYEKKQYFEEMAKQCAIICVDEILEALEHHTWQNKDWIRYYKEVKQEINKL